MARVALAILLVAGIVSQTHSVGSLVLPGTDEGVYLYASKLIANGNMIYRDFFLIHLPLWIYINVFLLKIFHWNLNLFHYVYAIFVVSGLIPIFLTTLRKSGVLAATTAGVLFLSFPEAMQWDAHFFAMRQASLPLLAWAIYFLTNKQYYASGVLLSLYAMGLVSNLFIAIILLGCWTMSKPSRRTNLIARQLWIPFSIIVGVYYIGVLRMPEAWQSIIGYQIQNTFVPYGDRLAWISSNMLKLNGAHWLVAGVGTGWALKKKEWLGGMTLASTLVILLASRTFYPHYLSSLGVLLALVGGSWVGLLRQRAMRIIVSLCIFLAIGITAGPYLYQIWFVKSSPEFFQIVKSLREERGLVFTFSPIYALYADKEIVPHYRVADARSLMALNIHYSEDDYARLLSKSDIVLLDGDTRYAFSTSLYGLLDDTFVLKEVVGDVEIWVRGSSSTSSEEKG